MKNVCFCKPYSGNDAEAAAGKKETEGTIMIKIEQTGGRLTGEEILHGKNDAYGIYQINWKGEGREYAFLSFDSLRVKRKSTRKKRLSACVQ